MTSSRLICTVAASIDDAASLVPVNGKRTNEGADCLQHTVLLKNSFEGRRVEAVVVGHHLDDTRQVGHQVTLISVR